MCYIGIGCAVGWFPALTDKLPAAIPEGGRSTPISAPENVFINSVFRNNAPRA
jgi:hypothetical protein